MNNTHQIKLGNLVITGDFDAPCAQNIAVVEKIDCLGFYHCLYLSTANRQKKARCKNPALVSDFGVAVLTGDLAYSAHPQRRCKATYSDGTVRRWQPEHGHPVQKANPHAFYLYITHLTGEQDLEGTDV